MSKPDFYESSFGGLRLFLSRLSTDKSRTTVVHEQSTGDDYTVQDRGRAPLKVRASVAFDWMRDDELAPIDRLRALSAAVDEKPRMLSHPIEGSFLARVGPFNYDIDPSGIITAEVEFIAVGEVQSVAPAGAGGIPASGEGAIAAASAGMTTELADIGLASTVPAAAAAAVDAWAASEDLNPRDVIAQTGSLTSQLGTQADLLDDDIEMWSAFKSTVLLAEAVRTAAEAATSESLQTFVVRIGAPIALRAYIASIYPADEAQFYFDRAMAINDIATPAWLEPGTELQLLHLPPRSRSG